MYDLSHMYQSNIVQIENNLHFETFAKNITSENEEVRGKKILLNESDLWMIVR